MEKTKLTRRDFLKASTATGVAAGFLASSAGLMKGLAKAKSPSAQGEVQVVPGFCHECHVQCGLLVHIKDGRAIKVEGMPDYVNRGAVCVKGQSTIKNLYSPERINYPLKRTNPKGDADPGWVRISWDEALSTIAAKFHEVKEKFGPEATGYSKGTGRYSNDMSARQGNSMGTTLKLAPSNICRGPMAATTLMSVGHYVRNDWAASRCMVFWGRNETWGHGAFQAPHIMDNLILRGSKLLVVDPRAEHPLAPKADVYLPVRPGSDGALMMSFINVIFEEELYDEEFVKYWTNGPFLVRMDNDELLREGDVVDGGDDTDFLPYPQCVEDRANRPTCMVWDTVTDSPQPYDGEGVEPALFGSYTIEGIQCKTALEILRERAAEWTPEKAAEICWTGSADKIREAARIYATSESASTDVGSFGYQGIEGGHTNTFQTIRTLIAMVALTGNFDKPGSDSGRPHWKWYTGEWKREAGLRGMQPWGAPDDDAEIVMEGDYPPGPALNEYPLQPNLPAMLDVFKAMSTDTPYPVKCILMCQGNPLGGWSEDQATVYQGLKDLYFMSDMDLYITPTGNLADILLPAGLGPFNRGHHKVLPPLFERWSDEKYFVELGKLIDPEWWFWETEEEMWEWREKMEGANIGGAKAAGFEIFRGAPAPALDMYTETDPKTGKPYGFATPTGRVEIYSVITHMYGKDHGIDPIPFYEEPAQSPYSDPELAKEYPLVLTTGARLPVYYHSEHRANPLQRELYPHPELDINPETAEELGIEHGDWVWIETKTGKIRMMARVTNGVDPRVISTKHGWWQGCRELGLPGYGWDGANANVLIDGEVHDIAVGVPGARSQLAKVYKADEPPFVWEGPYYGTTQPEDLCGPPIYPLQPGEEA
jgi:anaerobic selenocysteine-containing dehydrogenase